MSTRTGIEWTDATWNPIRGCSRVSEGCRHCYAEMVAARFSGPGQPYAGLARRTSSGEARWTGDVRFIEEHLTDPLRWTKPRRVFVNSMSDLFHERLSDDAIARVFAVMALAESHTFQVLTKRPARMAELLADDRFIDRVLDAAEPLFDLAGITEPGDRLLWPPEIIERWPLHNVWLGVSVEHQAAADERIPLLLETPAAVRFLSCEPLLGPVDLDDHLSSPLGCDGGPRRPDCERCGDRGLSWVIVGGESGHDARPMHPEWARSLRDQCLNASVPFFFKQWGEWKPVSQMAQGECDALYDPPPERDPEGRRSCRVPQTVLQLDGSDEFAFPAGAMTMYRVGKRRAGRELDGRTWDAMPEVRP